MAKPKNICTNEGSLWKFRTNVLTAAFTLIYPCNIITRYYVSIAGMSLESLGRQLSETILVCARKFAELPESPIHGYIGDGHGTTLRLAKFIPGPMQPETMKKS